MVREMDLIATLSRLTLRNALAGSLTICPANHDGDADEAQSDQEINVTRIALSPVLFIADASAGIDSVTPGGNGMKVLL